MHLLEAWGHVLSPYVSSLVVPKVSPTCVYVNEDSSVYPISDFTRTIAHFAQQHKRQKVASQLFFPSHWIWLFAGWFKHRNATRVGAEYTLLASKTKAPMCSARSVCLSRDSAENGLGYEFWVEAECWQQWQSHVPNSPVELIPSKRQSLEKKTFTDLMRRYEGGPYLPSTSRETVLFYPCDSYCANLKHNGVSGHRETTQDSSS